MSTKIPPKILKILQAVTAKRARTVIDHLIKHGHITTEELKEQYGYNHPPRAVRDVRERGIPLETFKVKDSTGRSIAAYRFGRWKDFRIDILRGRHTFSKQFKNDLVEEYGSKCSVCSAAFEERYLQIDHRIPYQVAGDDPKPDRNTVDYMLVCSSCNRAKSWSCEHCDNWLTQHNLAICETCYWASPAAYKHIAMSDIRRLDMAWQGEEVTQYDKAKRIAASNNVDMPAFVKDLIQKLLTR